MLKLARREINRYSNLSHVVKDVCNGRITLDQKFKTFRSKFLELDQRITSTSILEHSTICLKPCFEIKVKSKFRKARGKSYTSRGMKVLLNFKKTVKVTRYIKAYGLFDLVVEVGSCLGLWIGLSALGVFDLVLDTALWMKTKMGLKSPK